MTDYIKREDAIRSIADHDEFKGERWIKEAWADYLIEDAKTADVVPVVRCKDCKWWTEWGSNTGSCSRFALNWVGTDADDFCSMGERKDDER